MRQWLANTWNSSDALGNLNFYLQATLALTVLVSFIVTIASLAVSGKKSASNVPRVCANNRL